MTLPLFESSLGCNYPLALRIVFVQFLVRVKIILKRISFRRLCRFFLASFLGPSHPPLVIVFGGMTANRAKDHQHSTDFFLAVIQAVIRALFEEADKCPLPSRSIIVLVAIDQVYKRLDIALPALTAASYGGNAIGDKRPFVELINDFLHHDFPLSFDKWISLSPVGIGEVIKVEIFIIENFFKPVTLVVVFGLI